MNRHSAGGVRAQVTVAGVFSSLPGLEPTQAKTRNHQQLGIRYLIALTRLMPI
jgi:hypothetical protein